MIPLVQSLDGLAGTLLYLRGRYDIRSGFLSWSMLLRGAGIASGAHFGVTQAILGIPDDWLLAALVPVGWPAGHHGPLRRRPVAEVVSFDRWV